MEQEWGSRSELKKKQEWAKGKPKLDNARRLRGIHFIDPDDEEYKEILKNARRELERPMGPAMPCKTLASRKWLRSREWDPRRVPKRCMVEKWNLMNPQGNEWKPLHMQNTKTHNAGKGFTSMTYSNLVHKFIPMLQAMKIPDAKAAVDKEWKKPRDDPSMQFGKSQEQKGGSSGSA